MARATGAFTLVELLVVVAIIGLLVGLLTPSLATARKLARTTVCKTGLSGIGRAMAMYEGDHDGFVVPSYNMTGLTGGENVPLDGWACILDKEGLVPASRSGSGNIFYCPETFDVEGMKAGQTGTDPNNPKGWMDWPNLRLGNECRAVTIPERGFHRIIRVTYWINADNPVGDNKPFVPDTYYTSSVGYGPNLDGRTMLLTRSTAFAAPSRLLAAADGVYAGKHATGRIGSKDSRIGFRHPGEVGRANVVFADGHVGAVEGDRFPRGVGSYTDAAGVKVTPTNEEIRADNAGPATVFANPHGTLGS